MKFVFFVQFAWQYVFSDGRWTYKWDGENRLIRMDSLAQSNPSVKSMRLSFTYDGLSRRIRKDVYQDSPAHTTPPPTNGTLTRSEHYVYEGWNMILTAVDNGVGTAGSNTGGNINKRVASYVWGPDIGSKPYGRSSWQGAGGVGGLLIVTVVVDSGIGDGTVNSIGHDKQATHAPSALP